MKTTRKLIPAIAMLLVSAVMLTTASYAWFTMGEQVSATGMTVQAKAASTMLIIKKDATTDNQTLVARFSGATDNVSYAEDGAVTLIPSTYKAESATKLATVDDPAHDVDHVNGTLLGDAALVDVTAAGAGTNYIDYEVAIAVAGGVLENKNLVAYVTPAEFELPIHNALTIMFLVGEDKAATPAYVTHRSVEDINGDEGNKFNLGDMPIPQALTDDEQLNDYVTVIMRVYYDGALPDPNNEGKTYVRNSQIDSTGMAGFGVEFKYEVVESAEGN